LFDFEGFSIFFSLIF